ncbi:hypothetical protein ACIBO2_55875 [Nonomuraea sp. NPDC050022]|uniref:hypothetical protein n=1 Tax=unclassified Nonomuraea TaxID=2593643 RepID=UPI00340647D0
MGIRHLLAGTALAGSMVAGALAIAPTAQADAATATQAQSAQAGPRHFFGPYFSNGSENGGHESYFKGYWQKRGGNYYFYGDLYDRHHNDGDYSYVWFQYYDRHGDFHRNWYRSDDRRHFDSIRFKRDFKIQVCEGGSRNSGCGGWHDVF